MCSRILSIFLKGSLLLEYFWRILKTNKYRWKLLFFITRRPISDDRDWIFYLKNSLYRILCTESENNYSERWRFLLLKTYNYTHAWNASGTCAATETKLPQCRRITMSTPHWFTDLGRYWLIVSSLIQGPCEIRIPGPKHRQQWVQYVHACYLWRCNWAFVNFTPNTGGEEVSDD